MAGEQHTAEGSGPEGPISSGQSPRRRIALAVFAMWIFAAVNGVKLAGGFEARTPFAVAVFLVLCAVPLGLAAFLWRERG